MKHTKLFKNVVFGITCTLGLSSVITTGILLGQKQNILVETKAEIDTDSFYVGGVDIIADSDHHVDLGEGYAEFNTETNTLTLHNCTYSGEGTSWDDNVAALMLKDFYEDITIVLEGENTFTCTSNDNGAAGFLLCSNHNRKATIVGNEGSLTVRGKQYGFYCLNAGLIFESGTLNAISTGRTTNDDTLRYSEGLSIYTAAGDEDTGYLHQYKKDAVINANGGPLSSVPTYGGSYGINCWSVYNWIIDGATINATAGNVDSNNNLDSIGIKCDNNDVTIRNNTKLVSKGGEGTTKSYGFDNYTSSKIPIIISNDIKSLEFAGHTSAVLNNSRFRNSITGFFATEFDGSGAVTTLGTNTGKQGQPVTTANKNLKFQRITADVASFSGDYDGNEHSISITNLDPADSTVEYSVDGGETWSTTSPIYVNAGEYSINYRFSKPYLPTVNGTATVQINEIDIPNVSVTVTDDTIVYDGQPHKPTIATSPASAAGSTVTFTYSDTETGPFTTDVPEFTDVGAHKIYWKATCPNCKEATGVVEFTISEAPAPTPDPDPTPSNPKSGGLPGWGVALIVVGGVLGASCLAILALFIFWPRYVVDEVNKRIIRTIFVWKNKEDKVTLFSNKFRIIKTDKAKVFKTKADAEKALNK